MFKDPFDFIAGSIGIVIASKNDQIASMLIDYLSSYKVYTLKRVKSIKDAEIELLTSTCHICLDDLTLESKVHDRFEFLKKCSNEYPVIVIAKDGSIEDGFAAARFGACHVC